jgi:hypothetical protein
MYTAGMQTAWQPHNRKARRTPCRTQRKKAECAGSYSRHIERGKQENSAGKLIHRSLMLVWHADSNLERAGAAKTDMLKGSSSTYCHKATQQPTAQANNQEKSNRK